MPVTVKTAITMKLSVDLFFDHPDQRRYAFGLCTHRMENWLKERGYSPFGHPQIHFRKPDPLDSEETIDAHVIWRAVRVTPLREEF